MEISSRTTDSVIGFGDDGRFELRCNGTLVTSVEGLEPLGSGTDHRCLWSVILHHADGA
jgi:hypothetical protein